MFVFFFFNDTATTEIYTLSLHDALPICCSSCRASDRAPVAWPPSPSRTPPSLWSRMSPSRRRHLRRDRKSTRLNSSHSQISYAVFCLQKKKYQLCVILHSYLAVIQARRL